VAPQNPIEIPLVPLSLYHVGVRVALGDGAQPICVVDTGAAVTLIDRKLAAPLAEGFSGLTTIGGAGGASLGALAAVSLGLGGAPPQDEIAALSDLEVLRRFLSEEVGGVIGPGFLARYAVDLDLGQKLLRLHEGDFAPPPEAVALPLEQIRGLSMPTVRATLAGLGDVRLGLDTGAGTPLALLNVETPMIRALPGKRVSSPARGFAGALDAELGRGLTLELGPLKLENLPFLLARKSKNAVLKNAGLAGVIGPQALFGAKSRWIFDRRAGKVYVVADQDPAPRDRAGIVLAISEGRRFVDGVVPQSAAYEAGVREGDEFMGIVGYEASTRPEIARALAQPAGTRVELLIRRGEEQNPRTIPLILREYP
jgi:hypothetical protein